jgi:hypothetical protein
MKYLKLFEKFKTTEEIKGHRIVEDDEERELYPWDEGYNEDDEEDDDNNWNGPWMEVDDLDNDYVYDVFINDKRTPGGDTIKDDYGVIEVTYHKNGTINVEGFGKNIKDYLEDYGISSVPESDVNLIWDGDMGWETVDK